MQFLIDTDTESRAGLLMAAQVMALLAGGIEEAQGAADAALRPAKPLHPPAAPIGKPAPAAPVVPLPPNSAPPAPIVHPVIHPDAQPKEEPAPNVPAGTELDPAAVFGSARPLVPPPPADALSTAADPVPVLPGPAAVTTGTAESPSTAPAGERDSAGLPWDERIHSETRKTNADGTWRYRRNLDPNVKTAVTNELKATYGVRPVTPATAQTLNFTPQEIAASVVPPPPGATGTDHVPTPANVPPPPSAMVLPFPAQPTPAVPVPPSTHVGVPNASNGGVVQTVTSFRDLMTKVNVALAAGKLTQPQLVEACKAAGVEGVTALAAQPMLVPSVDTYLNRWLAA